MWTDRDQQQLTSDSVTRIARNLGVIPEPPDPGPECAHCDGHGEVSVAQYIDVNAQTHQVPTNHEAEIRCPRCDGTGTEPTPRSKKYGG